MSMTMLAPPQIGTLLGIWAHPDDEAYLSAGLMTQVRRSGGRVVVVTATRGEHGTDDPHRCPPDRVARVRERELHDSLDAVDVREHVCLGHPDGELGAMPRTVGVSQLVEILRLVRPDTIVTFGPEGMTGHTDHQTVSSWATEAWRTAGCPGALWYATFTPDFHERWGSVNEQAGLWFEGTVPAVTPHAELAAQVRCTGDLLTTKHRALRAHSSQTRPLERLVGSDVYREWWATESFVAARRD
ncbi:MAG: PIG-L deacetylase family protein [Marmoricola sp.]